MSPGAVHFDDRTRGTITDEFARAAFKGEIELAAMCAWDWALVLRDTQGQRIVRLDHPTCDPDGYPTLIWDPPWPSLVLCGDDRAPVSWTLVAGELPVVRHRFAAVPSTCDVHIVFFNAESSRFTVAP